MLGVPSFALDDSYQYECSGVSGFITVDQKTELIDPSKISNLYLSFRDTGETLSLYHANNWKVSDLKSLSSYALFQQFGHFFGNNSYEIYQLQYDESFRVISVINIFSQGFVYDQQDQDSLADHWQHRITYSCSALK